MFLLAVQQKFEVPELNEKVAVKISVIPVVGGQGGGQGACRGPGRHHEGRTHGEVLKRQLGGCEQQLLQHAKGAVMVPSVRGEEVLRRTPRLQLPALLQH
ncbi:hypothetical protein E2C01_018381 [Portunus trituberculatus]|uniref:Uncharacterized protein n=1 Tax=Portunus trituberculatus TaxID=210409 RepID=A0A5B7DVC6_PORTR|nr:hypothetical protein [Portunus trituberculatus]